jgi:PAS domain S-box-containing protein
MQDPDTTTWEHDGLRAEFDSNLRFETLIGQLSSKFINLPSDKVDREIEDAQRRICGWLGLDLCSLWQWSANDPGNLTLTHIYRPLEGPPIPERMAADEYFPWTLDLIRSGETLVLSSLDELPPEAAGEREVRRQLGIRSSLTFPLAVGGEPVVGALTFNTTQAERAWPEPLVNQLRAVAEVFANALARKRSDQFLRESEERLALAADSASMGLWSVDLASGCVWATSRALDLFGLPSNEVFTLDRFLDVVHPEDRESIRRTIKEIVQSRGEGEVEYRVEGTDGRVRWICSRGRARDVPGQPDRLTGVSVEITERKRAEQTIRNLGGRLIAAHEEERARLARELHDDVTQRLACLAIDVASLEPLPSVPSTDAILRRLQEGLAQLSEDVHALAYRLHPSVLADLGLADALRGECERFSRQESVPLDVTFHEIPESVPRDAALCVFRVVQEALGNVARHAKAENVEVSLRGLDGGLQVAVLDDGAGFDPAVPADHPALGLTGMRERVHLLGGALDIESAPGQGTSIVVWVPLGRGPS